MQIGSMFYLPWAKVQGHIMSPSTDHDLATEIGCHDYDLYM